MVNYSTPLHNASSADDLGFASLFKQQVQKEVALQINIHREYRYEKKKKK